MRSLSTLLSLSILFLFSCQKEVNYVSTTSRTTGTTGSDGLLVKTVLKTGSDSIVTTYGYSASKKLISQKKLGTDDQGNPVNTEYHIHRNSSGIITDYSAIDPNLVALGIDSVPTIVHYSSSRYTSYVIKVNVPGFILVDSSAFIYDGTGKIVGENVYESPSGTGNDYYLSGKVNYSYAASGNVGSFVIHDYNQAGAEVFTATVSNINYDSKINPINLQNEGFALGHYEWASPNNIVSAQSGDSNGPADDQTVTYTYTYNSSNNPATSTTTIVPGNSIGITAYFYQ